MKKEVPASAAHLMLLFTAVVWSTTFIASKLLLEFYTPIQIMLMRFVIAYAVLWAVRPKTMRLGWREELDFAVLGLTGCTLYFLGENYALTLTLASNVSILVASSPIFTAILAHFMQDGEKLNGRRVGGFIVAIAGVALVVFNGAVVLKMNPLGDCLTIAAALCWAFYTVKLRAYLVKYDGVLVTRRVMLWGLLTTLPIEIFGGGGFTLAPLADVKLLGCVLLLGVLGSALGYVLWSTAIRKLGSVVANSYIYLIPFFTMVAAYFTLHEPISWMGVAGAVLIVFGVFISDRKARKNEELL